MKTWLTLILAIALCVVQPLLGSAEAPSHTAIESLRSKTDFTVLLPDKLPFKARLEMKTPDLRSTVRPVQNVRLHYFDKHGQKMILGISQHRAEGYTRKRDEI